MIGWILRYGVGIYRYEPRYFYGKISEHYGSMNVFPYLVVTEHYAFQISTDRKKLFCIVIPILFSVFRKYSVRYISRASRC